MLCLTQPASLLADCRGSAAQERQEVTVTQPTLTMFKCACSLSASLSLPSPLAPSSVFRFSACPLVIMAFRTPSDARHSRSYARSHPIQQSCNPIRGRLSPLLSLFAARCALFKEVKLLEKLGTTNLKYTQLTFCRLQNSTATF